MSRAWFDSDAAVRGSIEFDSGWLPGMTDGLV